MSAALVQPSDVVALAIVAAVAVVPVASVVIVALLRGYRISLHMQREQKGSRHERE